MRVLLTGATGFIGRHLCRRLQEEGHQVRLLARNPPRASQLFPKAEVHAWDALQGPPAGEVFRDVQVVIHLAGEGIADRRWSAARKQAIRESRVRGTAHLVEGILRADPPPAVLLSASAVGYYGDRGDEVLDEESPPGEGFLPEVCVAWEGEAKRAAEAGVRVVLLRTGIVLSPEGGALASMLPPFRWFVGGPLGSGRQWMSWIHLEDEVGAMLFALQHASLQGPVNLTAPQPVPNRVFSRTLGKVLRRPSFWWVPAPVLRLMLGEMAQELLLSGQRVLPEKLRREGYSFRFPALEEALRNLLL